jgi:glycine hydroxymethyltransferase
MRVKPRLIMLGASEFLFPHPIKEFKEVASEVNAILTYDGAHVLGLIAGDCFQDPLREGVEILTGSTHKTFFGPQGGIIISVNKYANLIDHAVWQLVNNHHIHRVAGLAVTLCEFLAFGRDYAKQVVKNAKRLAESLYNYGIDVLCPYKGFTESHQVLFKVPGENGESISKKLEEANIITNKVPLPWDPSEEECSGIRIGTQEITRLGMKEEEMEEIASLIRKVILDKEDPSKIKREVETFMRAPGKAYEYFSFRTFA